MNHTCDEYTIASSDDRDALWLLRTVVLRDTDIRWDFENSPELTEPSAKSMGATGAHHVPFFGPDAEAYVAVVRDRLGLTDVVELHTEEEMCCLPNRSERFYEAGGGA
ncbi:hypothetical protein [Streptomyces coeruleorubidus]|uniref:hypothetical protein n=1 Tax=Streptomyces coeruleorubidus TaxID=116188 RepID=UPI00379FB75B